MRTEIIYEDNDITVIYKPAGLPTQTSRVGEADVVSELKNHRKGGYVGLVHRLDQPVEGLLVFGNSSGAAAALSRQLTQKGLGKEYLAVVLGKPEPAEGVMEDLLVQTKDHRAQVAKEGTPDAKRAKLSYKVVEQRKDCAVVSVTLETGRFHQIRAQFSHRGWPLLGDRKYGTEEAAKRASTVALCAVGLTFTHPKSGKEMKYEITPKGAVFQ